MQNYLVDDIKEKIRGVIIVCARYTVFSEEEIIEMNAIIAEVSRRFGPDAISTGEIFPTNNAPILILENGRLTPAPAYWGFHKWGDSKGVIINARSESALQKPMFSKPLLSRRCIIPSTGFYEWTLANVSEEDQMSLFSDAEQPPPSKAKKVKLHFRVPGDKMLYMAGIMNTFTDEHSNQRDSFCILTTEATHTIARFHERMPVIVSPGEREDWLNSDAFMREALARKGPDLEWRRAG
jgi:putative SOS response-associated peptidase YedK